MNVRQRPILMSTPMVRALLAGIKRQTRRLLTPQPTLLGDHTIRWKRGSQWKAAIWTTLLEPHEMPAALRGEPGASVCPYGAVGDQLYVREAWAPKDPNKKVFWSDPNKPPRVSGGVIYKADVPESDWGEHRWRPGIHLPRGDCRIVRTVESVRVEHLQAITEADSLAEGCEPNRLIHWTGTDPNMGALVDVMSEQPPDSVRVKNAQRCPDVAQSARQTFIWTWDALNAERASWEENPWVWVIGLSATDAESQA